jgi:hypothetical protein
MRRRGMSPEMYEWLMRLPRRGIEYDVKPAPAKQSAKERKIANFLVRCFKLIRLAWDRSEKQ